MDADARLQTVAACIAPVLMASARERQHLAPEAAEAEVLAAVSSSLDKVCEIERQPGLLLAEVVTDLDR